MREGTDTKLLSTDVRPQNTMNVKSDFGEIFFIPISPLRTPVRGPLIKKSTFFKDKNIPNQTIEKC